MSEIEKLLQAPCVFCYYNGELYWQEESHKESCPFYGVGGVEDRKADLCNNVIPSFQATIDKQAKIIEELEADNSRLERAISIAHKRIYEDNQSRLAK